MSLEKIIIFIIIHMQCLLTLSGHLRDNIFLLYDVASGSEITSCNKIDKPLVVYRFSGKRYDVHHNVAHIMTKL